ncbi:MAG: MFS transporter, partial [Micromonosporaceae bacterium]
MPQQPALAEQEAPPVNRFGLGATMLLAMGVAPVMQYAVGVLAPFLVEDAGVTRLQVGLYTSMLFVIAAIGSPVFGVLVDRLWPRAVLSSIFLFGGLSAVLAAGARSYGWLVASAMAAGMPMALTNPVTNRLVQAHVPAGSRGRLMGIKQSGVMVAQTMVGFTLPPLALWVGWRGAFLAALAITCCGLVLTWSTIPAWTAQPRAPVAGQPRRRLPSGVRWIAVYAAFMGAGQAAFSSYLALYAYQRVHVSEARAGLTVGLVGLVAAASRIGWAPAVERSVSLAFPLRLVALGAVPAAACLAAAEHLGWWVLLIGALGYAASGPVWNVPGMLAVFRLVEADVTGKASGWIYMGFSCGFMVGPVAFALLVETFSYQVG